MLISFNRQLKWHQSGWETTEIAVFDVEPFGRELDSAELIEVKAEGPRRNEGNSVFWWLIFLAKHNLQGGTV